jgi:hypothetical protein
MPWIKVGAAVVVVAQQFNPSIVTQLWLSRNAGMRDEDFLAGCVFTDLIVQIRSRQFHMLVVPEQMQFLPLEAEEQQIIHEKLGAIVGSLPHTPYRAVGLNFTWHLSTQRTMPEVSREMFFRTDRALYQNFTDAGAHFGAYLSKDSSGFRLKLDVKPVLVQLEDRTEHRLQFAFNFHRDFTENHTAQLEQCLLLWDAAKREVETIIDSVERREEP